MRWVEIVNEVGNDMSDFDVSTRQELAAALDAATEACIKEARKELKYATSKKQSYYSDSKPSQSEEIYTWLEKNKRSASDIAVNILEKHLLSLVKSYISRKFPDVPYDLDVFLCQSNKKNGMFRPMNGEGNIESKDEPIMGMVECNVDPDDVMKDILSRVAIKFNFPSKWRQDTGILIKKITDVFIHEVNHLVQYIKGDKRLPTKAYNADNTELKYLTSRTEIDAWATSAVTDLLHGSEQYNKTKKLTKDQVQDVLDNLIFYIRDPSHLPDSKAKKFLKIVDKESFKEKFPDKVMNSKGVDKAYKVFLKHIVSKLEHYRDRAESTKSYNVDELTGDIVARTQGQRMNDINVDDLTRDLQNEYDVPISKELVLRILRKRNKG